MCLDHADNAWRAVGARGDLAIAATLSIMGAATSLPDLPPPQLSDAGEHPYGAAGGEGRDHTRYFVRQRLANGALFIHSDTGTWCAACDA